jgi:hypothetical protein
MISGSCFCGTVRYEVSGPFGMMMSCHCSMCRKHHGSAFATYVSAPADRFRWISGEDSLLRYKSSEQGRRTSCKVCGSALPEVLSAYSLVVLPAGPLEGDLGIKPQAHIFVGSKAPWYTITDDLPQHKEYPPEMGGQPVLRPKIEARPGVTEGSCLCGAVAYEAEGEPMLMQSCHCERCRRARGAAHATNIFFKIDQFRWKQGEELLAEYKLPEARFYTTSFCRQCGGAMPKVSSERGIVVVPAGSLDTDPPARPQRQVFTNYKAHWFDITDTIPQFQEAPPPAR